jgi:hypothetical protein
MARWPGRVGMVLQGRQSEGPGAYDQVMIYCPFLFVKNEGFHAFPQFQIGSSAKLDYIFVTNLRKPCSDIWYEKGFFFFKGLPFTIDFEWPENIQSRLKTTSVRRPLASVPVIQISVEMTLEDHLIKKTTLPLFQWCSCYWGSTDVQVWRQFQFQSVKVCNHHSVSERCSVEVPPWIQDIFLM